MLEGFNRPRWSRPNMKGSRGVNPPDMLHRVRDVVFRNTAAPFMLGRLRRVGLFVCCFFKPRTMTEMYFLCLEAREIDGIRPPGDVTRPGLNRPP